MRSWLLRGLVFAFVTVVFRIVQAPLVNGSPTHYIAINLLLGCIISVVPLIWGFIDGRSDAKAQPDPDRRADLAMTWLVAGVASGAVCLVIKLFYDNIYVEGPINELTVFACFTALLTFLMAMIGVAVGRMLVDRRYNKEHPVPHHDHSHPGEGSPSTDVFAAVSSGRRQREEMEGSAAREVPPLEVRGDESPTQVIRTDEARTQEVRTEEIRGESAPTQEAPTRPHRTDER